MKKLLLMFSLVLILASCTEEKTVNNYGYDKTLVIIADDEPSSEMILSVKGSIAKENPDVKIDYYQAKPFDISEASYLLQSAAEDYPEDTYFVVIVDPGTDTPKVVFKSGSRTVIAPDNGTTTRFRNEHSLGSAYFVEKMTLFDNEYTDINDVPVDHFYSNLVNYVLAGGDITQLGSEAEELVDIEIQEPVVSGGTAMGEVLYVNNFGNCETNIPSEIMENYENGTLLEITAGTHKFFAKYGTGYSSVEKGENVVFLTGNKKLRLAVSYGDMAERYDIASGTKLTIKEANVKVGILQYNNSDLVQSIVAGTGTSMANKGFTEGDNVTYVIKNGMGDIPALKGLVEELVAEGCDIIVPVSTPASQAAVNFTPDSIPVVFTYVTSPEFAGILNVRSGVTGLSDATNIKDYLDFVTELMPNISKAGRIYNPNEANSEFFQDVFKNNAHLYELEYQTEEVNSGNEIQSAFSNLQSYDPDVILIAADNTLNLNMEQLAQLCKDSGLPLIGDSHQNTEAGALASISVDYDELATSTGVYVSSVILGMPPAELPIKKFGNSVISLNAGTASVIGFEFSQDMLDKAAEVLN